MMISLPDKVRKNHTDINLLKPFGELSGGRNSISAALLVATLHRVWELGGVLNAVKIMGLTHNSIYNRLHVLESRLKHPVFVRFLRPFTLTEQGEKLVREYLDD